MKTWTRNLRARIYYLKRPIINSFYAGRQLIVMAYLRIRQDSELIGKKISDMGKSLHVFVISIGRDGEEDLFPSGDTRFAFGDRITIQAFPKTLKELHKLNRDPEPY